MGDIVEHVAKAMCEHDHGPASSSAWNVHFGQYREVAAPAIRATLEYLRENVSEGMAIAGLSEMIEFPMENEHAIAPFRAMLSAALNDIEGGTG